jgi:hypothetical protein
MAQIETYFVIVIGGLESTPLNESVSLFIDTKIHSFICNRNNKEVIKDRILGIYRDLAINVIDSYFSEIKVNSVLYQHPQRFAILAEIKNRM